MKVTIGIDPDSESHGIAIYEDGVLTQLHHCTLIQLWSLLDKLPSGIELTIGIEDVQSQTFVYSRNQRVGKAAQGKVSHSIGRCAQAQLELERMIAHCGYTVVRFKPRAGNWAKNTSMFKERTGWRKRSNEDTRSAAFFGYLAQGCVIHRISE